MNKSSRKRPLREVEIQAMIASDPDNPELTDEQIAKGGRSFAEVLPELARNLGGRPKKENPKQAISIRLDSDVIAKFKATGPGWQTRMNAALKRAKV